MQFLKNNIWTFCLVAVFSLLTFAGDASAQSSVMQTSQEKALNVFTAVKTIISLSVVSVWSVSLSARSLVK